MSYYYRPRISVIWLFLAAISFPIQFVHSFAGYSHLSSTRPSVSFPSQPHKISSFISVQSPVAFHPSIPYLVPLAANSKNNNDIDVSSLSERLKIGDRFDRWKFLQNLIDDFVEEDDVHQLLYAVLDGFIKYPKTIKDVDDDDNEIIIATSQQREIVKNLLESFQESQRIECMSNPDDDTIPILEQLLPDPQEDEDGFKSSWDTVIEIHGRELVKAMEEGGTDRWKALSTVARLLVHYEFLTEGIVDAPR